VVKPKATDILLVKPSSDLAFRDQKEAQYFCLFRDQVIPSLGRGYSFSVWSRICGTIVLQACHSEEFVREATVAFSALRAALVSDRDISATHNAVALSHYGRAIHNMRELLSTKENDIRKALVGCLLLCGFEMFQGNRKLTNWHAQGGYQLLQSWMARQKTCNGGSVMFSPHPTIVEDDILYAFYHLDLQIMAVGDDRPIDIHIAGKSEGGDEVKRLPVAFSDLDEAYRYWLLIMRRNWHFYHYVKSVTGNSTATCNISPTPPRTARNSQSGNSPYLPIPHKDNHILIPLTSECIMSEQKQHRFENLRWQAAFDPFLSLSKTQLHVTLMDILMKANKIRIDLLLKTSEDVLRDGFVEQFQELLRLAEQFVDRTSSLSQKSGTAVLSVDVGIVSVLVFIYTACPDSSIRRDALRILALSPRKEGVLDSLESADIGTRTLDLEERHIDESHI
jgi:hypothetical protein